jgi:hypothetical protein
MNFSNKTNSNLDNYENNYIELPFENILREYRKKNIHKALENYSHNYFLEIGCGPYPLFRDINDFDRMIVIEPCKLFYEMAKRQANFHPKITVINDLIENVIDKLQQEPFSFIVIGGFLHEINNPDIVLQAVRQICSKDTTLYAFVPNAKSFHRLLALEMGIIDSIYQKSGHDELFQRQNVYDIDTFNDLLLTNGFNVIEYGSYFIKPFTHDQMNKLTQVSQLVNLHMMITKDVNNFMISSG